MPHSSCDPTLALVIDLDGTLLRTDLLYENLLAVAKSSPLKLLRLPFWLLRGKANVKARLAAAADVPVEHLPFDERVLQAMREHPAGTKVLCTASDERLAQRVAAAVGGFDEVFASDGRINLSGHRKADALVARFGEKGFIYVGNARPDVEVWRHAAAAWVVNAGKDLAESAARVTRLEQHWPAAPQGLGAWSKALRLHQWLKNLLVFAPLLAAHQVFDPANALLALAAFFAFGLGASAVYVVNDLFDIEADRQHPTKRHRPFASGRLPLLAGIIMAPLLGIASLAMAAWVGSAFLAWLLTYLMLTTAYTLVLKQLAIADIIALATLYTLRIFAGAAAVSVDVSFWLLAFSVFIFLSLALVKRYTELHDLRERGKSVAVGRGYGVADLPLLASFGSASGYVAALVLALYVDAAGATGLYTSPEFLWGLCPILLGWISRVWLLAHRGQMHDDPVVFAAHDRTSWALCAVSLAVVVAAL